MTTFPFLTAYDPPGSSEGTLDPMGLYMIADQLATRLVPAVRERMQRIRFLTALTVGALVTEDLEPNDRHPHVLPYLVWEWFVVEAIVRTIHEDEIWGLPGSLVTKRALSEHGYLDERSYLKTPRIFGFHGVYKRLAIHLGLVDGYLRFRAPHGEELVSHWAQDCGLGQFDAGHPLCQKWRRAVKTSLRESPVQTHTSPRWKEEDWRELADAFVPHRFKCQEKQCLARFLLTTGEDGLGALIPVWSLLGRLNGEEINEREFHRRLHNEASEYGVLLDAIAAYESFCRNLTDAFDILRAEGSRQDVQGFQVPSLRNDHEFRPLADRSHGLYEDALRRLSEVDPLSKARFIERFEKFSEPVPADQFAIALCDHHEVVQRAKSREGKRPWFERMGPERVYVRQNYRVTRPDLSPNKYVHEYRTNPIYRFYRDLQ
ncbi:MAG: hypothetical protein GXY83_44460 [Rhodopirellula sp.]|nr:hypothetical protein [Rhodopirellula sp.]